MTNKLAHSKLKYGLFNRVISCHDRSAQNCHNSCSKCASSSTRTQAVRQRRISRVSNSRKVTVLCSRCAEGAVLLKHKKTHPGTTCTCLNCSGLWTRRLSVCHGSMPLHFDTKSYQSDWNPVLAKNLEHPRLTRCVVMWPMWVRWNYSIQFQPLCHLPTKIYYNLWKFDEVLTETKMHCFFRHGVYNIILYLLGQGSIIELL